MRPTGRRTLVTLTGVLGLVLLASCGDDTQQTANESRDDTTEGREESDRDTGSEDIEPEEETGEDGGEDGDADRADADDADEQADDGGLLVVSSVAPIAEPIERVLGDRGEVATLVPDGADSHTYEPSPSDVAPLSEADAFIGNGLGLNDASVDLAEANLPDDAPLVLLGDEALEADDLSHEHWHDHDNGHTHDEDDGHTHDEDDGHTHDDDNGHTHDDDNGHTHDDDGHAHDEDGAPNPHVWTSVPNVTAYVESTAEELADLDPDGADVYQENAANYTEQLDALHEAIADSVETVPDGQRRLVVYHDAWSYFGEEYGLEVTAAVQPGDFSEPSASDVRDIIDQIQAEDVPALFGSEEFPADVVSTIADETGAAYVGDLADDQLPGEPGDVEHSYVGMMVDNVSVIVDSLGGDASALNDVLER
ncbi:zinc ABC transporter substrate-binding protein [Egibacter rhizosphaerae]|uniref:Zinc ABC transporter substrate-binding protein n=1 Tax=Egibacter rhizosphaerae TaxID=1670831 RepID=A0A411YE54_9ACTN|nr:metal ABC transporter substrate-binding protein [Egibacter rhizosphaerae]QBI19495.1 zinc ABC transporter substrate-binding protein [Egibacter rhizosphaerae]